MPKFLVGYQGKDIEVPISDATLARFEAMRGPMSQSEMFHWAVMMGMAKMHSAAWYDDVVHDFLARQAALQRADA